MKKFEIYLITGIFIISNTLSLTACTTNDVTNTATESAKNEIQNNEDKDSKIEDKDSKNESKKKSNTSPSVMKGSGNAPPYDESVEEIDKTLDGKIAYPVFVNINNKDKVNQLILNHVEKINSIYSKDNPSLKINCDIEFQNKKYLSLLFWGYINKKGETNSTKVKITLNIDIDKAEIMRLNDIVNISERFLDAANLPVEAYFRMKNQEVLDEYKKENLKVLLEQSDSNTSEDIPKVQSYFSNCTITIMIQSSNEIDGYFEIPVSSEAIDNKIDCFVK